MWIRKFFLTLAMISMAFPTCPVTIDIKTIPHYAFTHGLANQLEHLERSITDTGYMDTLSEEEIWKSFTILSTLIRDNSDQPLETLLLEEDEVREEIASYLQERVNRFHYSMQQHLKPLACGGVIYSVKKAGKATAHGLKKAGQWLWKNKWVIVTIVVIAILAYFGIRAYQNKKTSSEDTTSSAPTKKTTIAKAAEHLLPKAQKELKKDLEKELKKNLENIENPTPEKQAQSIAKTSLKWATNTWLECQKFSRDIANQFCHEVLDHAAPMAELAAIISDQLKKELSTIFAHTMRDYGNGNTAQENVEQLTSFMRNAIDEMLASKRTIPYQGATDDPLTNLIDPQLVNLLKPKIGIIPFSPYGPPGTKEAAKAAKQAKNLLRKQIKAEKKIAHQIAAKGSRGLTIEQKNQLFSSIKKAYNEHLTELSHALSKHAGRHPEKWGKLKGPMSEWHNQAMKQFKEIYHAPGKFKKAIDQKTGIVWIEKRLPDGRGIRLNRDFTFKGFVD